MSEGSGLILKGNWGNASIVKWNDMLNVNSFIAIATSIDITEQRLWNFKRQFLQKTRCIKPKGNIKEFSQLVPKLKLKYKLLSKIRGQELHIKCTHFSKLASYRK